MACATLENPKSIKMLYRVSRVLMPIDKDTRDAMMCKMESFCDATIRQAIKITNCVHDNSPDAKRRLDAYCDDLIQFSRTFKRRYLSNDTSNPVTPMRMTPSPPPSTHSPDLEFVLESRNKSTGRFSWVRCYEAGKKQNLFSRYTSHLYLKEAFTKKNL
ncbi:hypothetical protein DM01DRAFT_1009028 [Hesseltinella vesiculosa]|uniref:Uncharacterized protein n=1 Tax=Hesseltinella vesiculosa TaxID=101127 RepID=A0A1X2GXY2_9FUNG|nr:hypothetical protein DM01DRAFT_1009028 [Hesseltinella vesiculosa]